MTWKSGKDLNKQAVTLLHRHAHLERRQFACHLPSYHRPRECWTCHFTHFSRTGWWLSTIKLQPLPPLSSCAKWPGTGSLCSLFLMPVWPLWQMKRTVCDKGSHSQTCATDSPGGFVKTWIARPSSEFWFSGSGMTDIFPGDTDARSRDYSLKTIA